MTVLPTPEAPACQGLSGGYAENSAEDAEQLHHRHFRQLPLRYVCRGAAEDDQETGPGGAALVVCLVDGALALQPADGPAAPQQPEAGLRVGVLQKRFPSLQRAARVRGNQLPVAG